MTLKIEQLKDRQFQATLVHKGVTYRAVSTDRKSSIRAVMGARHA